MTRIFTRENLLTDTVPRRGATSSKAGLDIYRRIDNLEKALGCGAANDVDEMTLYRALGADIRARTFDPGTGTAGQNLVSGTGRFSAMYLPGPATVNGLAYRVTTAGVGTWTIGKIGLYNLDGQRVAQSVNDLSLFKTAGNTETLFTAPIALERGVYYAVFLNVRSATTTTPQIACRTAITSVEVNLRTDSARPRCAILAGMTDLSASVTMTSLAISNVNPFAALY